MTTLLELKNKADAIQSAIDEILEMEKENIKDGYKLVNCLDLRCVDVEISLLEPGQVMTAVIEAPQCVELHKLIVSELRMRGFDDFYVRMEW